MTLAGVIFDAAVRTSVVLGIALAACATLRHRSAAVRHMVLAAGVCSAVMAAPLTLVMPEWDVPLARSLTVMSAEPAVVSNAPATTIEPVAPIAAGRRIGDVVAGALTLGSAIAIGLLLAAFIRLSSITAGAQRVIDDRWLQCAERVAAGYAWRGRIALLRTRTRDVIATWGLFRPCVLLPCDADGWDERRMQIVLAHEFAHVRRRDWLVQLTAEIARAVFWFNPLFWLACRRLRRESEQACDDAVLRTGVAPAQYAAELVGIARACRTPRLTLASAVPIARPSSLERRITAMLNTHRNRREPSRRHLAITVIGFAAIAVGAAAASASKQTEPLPLTGYVFDSTGGVLPEVALTLDGEHSASWRTTADSSGRFEFPPISPGHFVLSASMRGFRPLRHELVLSDTRDWERAITLQVGTVQESIVVTDRRGPGSAHGSLAAGSALRVGGNIRAPQKTKDVKPVYPASMRDAGLEGVVPIEAVIGTDGLVSSVRVVSAQVHPDFAIAAVDAVRQWRFTPTLLNGSPVEIVMTVTVQFGLSD